MFPSAGSKNVAGLLDPSRWHSQVFLKRREGTTFLRCLKSHNRTYLKIILFLLLCWKQKMNLKFSCSLVTVWLFQAFKMHDFLTLCLGFCYRLSYITPIRFDTLVVKVWLKDTYRNCGRICTFWLSEINFSFSDLSAAVFIFHQKRVFNQLSPGYKVQFLYLSPL
jgi:hypothetical protein